MPDLITVYVLPGPSNLNGIIGDDTLKELNSFVDNNNNNNIRLVRETIQILIKTKISDNVNIIYLTIL